MLICEKNKEVTVSHFSNLYTVLNSDYYLHSVNEGLFHCETNMEA